MKLKYEMPLQIRSDGPTMRMPSKEDISTEQLAAMLAIANELARIADVLEKMSVLRLSDDASPRPLTPTESGG
jgi:hypothetical protein